MEGADGLVCVPCAPVVKDAEGKKRRHDGQACEAPGCGEFFSSNWYAQNRCCSKAECKRFFGVAGVYQPKKAPKGILRKPKPLADRSNEQQEGAAAKPAAAVAKKPAAPAAKQPGSEGERRPLAAIEALRERFGSGCFRHGAAKDDCEACELNKVAFEACKEAELTPFRRSIETFQLVVQHGLLSASISFKQPMQKGERRLPVTAWARHMNLWVTDRETNDDVFEYDGRAAAPSTSRWRLTVSTSSASGCTATRRRSRCATNTMCTLTCTLAPTARGAKSGRSVRRVRPTEWHPRWHRSLARCALADVPDTQGGV